MTSSSTVLKRRQIEEYPSVGSQEYSTNSSMMAAYGYPLCLPASECFFYHQESKQCNMSFSVLPLVFNKKYFMYNLQ